MRRINRLLIIMFGVLAACFFHSFELILYLPATLRITGRGILRWRLLISRRRRRYSIVGGRFSFSVFFPCPLRLPWCDSRLSAKTSIICRLIWLHCLLHVFLGRIQSG